MGQVTYGWKLLKVNHHSTKFGGHRRFGSEDIMGFISLQFERPHDQSVK